MGSIPIYWGSERVVEDFNKDSYINAADFSNFKELAEYVKMVDNTPKIYEQLLNAPVFEKGEIPIRFQPENVLSFIEEKIIC